MIAARQIRCKVIVVETEGPSRGADTHGLTPRFKPSDLLPWSDPTIAGLVKKLQHEVREESAAKTAADRPVTKNFAGAPASDLEWPWGEDDFEFDFEPVE